MAQSLAKITIHVVFSTKNRKSLLPAAIRKAPFALHCEDIALPLQGGYLFLFPYPGRRRYAPLPWANMLRPFRPVL
jgi:hypothetical protein